MKYLCNWRNFSNILSKKINKNYKNPGEVHKELVHQTQHAATCRICEFNFSEPAVLLKHMAAVHSTETPPTGLLGAYRCMICRFMSPLYTG